MSSPPMSKSTSELADARNAPGNAEEEWPLNIGMPYWPDYDIARAHGVKMINHANIQRASRGEKLMSLPTKEEDAAHREWYFNALARWPAILVFIERDVQEYKAKMPARREVAHELAAEGMIATAFSRRSVRWLYRQLDMQVPGDLEELLSQIENDEVDDDERKQQLNTHYRQLDMQ